MQVFCSESGEWWEMNLRNAEFDGLPFTNALTWNGKLCWADYDEHTDSAVLYRYDPFRPYSPAEPMYENSGLWGHFSVSQGALHMVTFMTEDATKSLSVWRREGDGWRRKHQTVLKMKSPSWWGDYKLEDCFVLDLHPEEPEIVFFEYQKSPQCIFSCNLRKGTGEPEFFAAAEFCTSDPAWRVLQPRVSCCWPTPIPRYEELRGLYDGSYDCWVQHNDTTTLLPSTTIGK
ncbi:unnamed protein product [Linum trigynum]|uniref:F-box protein At3g26010-like beta-propeller domain-containing protein n=1 Tax=Linum trigynum TaxID=586398 RepID=A0AAV2FK38_9ROSI